MEKKVITVEEFNKLPKAIQRTMIAQDVIKQIEAKKYTPKKGIYI